MEGEHLHWGFSFSLCIVVPVCCEAWIGQGARSPLFSYTCCCAHFLHMQYCSSSQETTCYQILALLRLGRQKEELGMQCMSEVLDFLLTLEGWNANCGPETAVQQVFYIWTEKLRVFPCQSSCICDYSCGMETQGQASFTEVESHSCSVYNGKIKLPWILVLCMHRTTVVC